MWLRMYTAWRYARNGTASIGAPILTFVLMLIFSVTLLYFLLSRILITTSCLTTKTPQSFDTRRERHAITIIFPLITFLPFTFPFFSTSSDLALSDNAQATTTRQPIQSSPESPLARPRSPLLYNILSRQAVCMAMYLGQLSCSLRVDDRILSSILVCFSRICPCAIISHIFPAILIWTTAGPLSRRASCSSGEALTLLLPSSS